MTRKLVTIREVVEIKPIEGADNIEVAVVDGWECVVKKGEFKKGDEGLYFEIDSFLPALDERFKFLEKNFTTFQNRLGARIRTIKLRKQVSQGLLLPLKDFPEISNSAFMLGNQDFSEKLGVVKWERAEDLSPKARPKTGLGKLLSKYNWKYLKPIVAWLDVKFPGLMSRKTSRVFPSFIPKTDEERLQNYIRKDFFKEKCKEIYEVTIKLDGSSMTVYQIGKDFGVCSRNMKITDVDDKFYVTALQYGLKEKLKALGRNLAIQGELMGPGIQGNREGLKEYEFFVYNIFDIDRQQYIFPGDRMIIMADLNGLSTKVKCKELQHVPVIDVTQLNPNDTIEDYLARAEGPSLNSAKREGLVYKSLESDFSFKIIANSYLLKYGE